MSFYMSARKSISMREEMEVEKDRDSLEEEWNECILEHYGDTLNVIYGNKENIPLPRVVKRRQYQFTTNESEEESYVKLNRSQMCMIRGETFKGNWFIYLITLPDEISSKTDSHVGWTTNPLVDIYLLNKGHTIYKNIDRNISMAIPHWRLHQVIGTLTCEEQAKYFANIWVDHTRGQKSKQNKAPFLTEAADAALYTFSERLGEGETMESLLNSLDMSEKFRSQLLYELNK